ncbi:MAG: hypothetical protein JNK92_12105 [Dechloromonas sp.]|nr:hypothetical protein [Dechloromonas sp.]
MAYTIVPAPAISHQSPVPGIDRQVDDALDGASCRVLIAPVDVLLPDSLAAAAEKQA